MEAGNAGVAAAQAIVSGVSGPSRLTTVYLKLKDFVSDYNITLKVAIIFAATIAFEEILEHAAFKCPSTVPENQKVGWGFLIVPAIVLFVFGVTVFNAPWRAFHGCFRRCCKDTTGKRTSCCPGLTCCFVGSQLSAVAQTLVAPASWFIIAFLDGHYWECIASLEPGVDNAANAKLRDESRFFGLIFTAVVMSVLLLVWSCPRCCSTMPYNMRKMVKKYRVIEEPRLEKGLQRMLKELAKRNVETVVHQVCPDIGESDLPPPRRAFTEKDWHEITTLPDDKKYQQEAAADATETDIDTLEKFPFALSNLHAWVQREARECFLATGRSQRGDGDQLTTINSETN